MNAPSFAENTNAPLLLCEVAGATAILTLDQPETRNTLSEAMLSALGKALGEIAEDHNVRAVVLAANGPVFSAGHDLKELNAHRAHADGGRAYFHQIMQACSAVMQMIVRLPQPVIAAVEGTATAAGCQLVASCDLGIASATAKFGTSGINAGLFCSTPMVALSRKVARAPAMEMLLTGDLIPADEALRIGLVNRVVPADQARSEALALADKIAAKSASAVRLGKEAFYRQLEMGLSEAYSYTSDVMVQNMLTGDAEEGIAAFIEKRPPQWRDS